MTKSIRSRLQWWYTSIYAASISVFGLIVYWRAHQDVQDRATLQAMATAQYLDVSFRSMPPDQPLPMPPGWFEGPPGNPEGPPFRDNGPGRPPFGVDQFPDSIGPPQNVPGVPPDGPRRDVPRGGPDQAPFRNPQRSPGLPHVPPELLNRIPLTGSIDSDGRTIATTHLDRIEFAVWSPGGKLLAGTPGAADVAVLAHREELRPNPAPVVRTLPEGILVTKAGPFRASISVLRHMRHDIGGLHRFGLQLAMMATVTIGIGIAGGIWISGRMIQPIQEISATASRISVTHLDRRIALNNLDAELIPLALVLNETFQRLEHSFRRLNQFTADASHELRTPLAIIQSQAELALSQTRSAESYQQTLQTCLRSAERMTSLVDGLLLLARSDAERLNLRMTVSDFRLIVEDAVAQFQDRAIHRGIELNCTTPEQPVMVHADPTFLGQVPSNLIQNALAYTPDRGSISVDVDTDGATATLRVRDTGCGIPAEHMPLLFDRFYRVDKARSRQDGGSGLGLAICHSLVEAHGGTIRCESEPGHGSLFEVQLPLSTQLKLNPS